MTLYRGYDRAALDTQYNLRGRHPDHPAIFARWRADSDAARRALTARLDLPYGAGPLERLDVFPATGGSGPSPILAFIHGGYWQSLDKADFAFLAPPFVARGIAFASLNYALAPAAGMDAIVAQARAAIAWLGRNAASFGGDRDRLFVCGHSAGGHLAAMLLATDWPAFAPDLPPHAVRGGCAISGVFDLEPVSLSYLNEGLRLDPEAAARNSPIALPPPPKTRLVLGVGGEETPEFLRQQADFAARWREGGATVTELVLPGLHHFTVLDPLARAEGPLFTALSAMIGYRL